MIQQPEEHENLWGYAKRLRFVEEALTVTFPDLRPESIRVLDVGCGNGSQLAVPLARRGFEITALDTDARSIEHARQLGAGIPHLHFLLGSLEQLCAPAFDAVILSEVLEHQAEPGALLIASLQHLRNGGIVIVTVPNGYGEFEIDSCVFGTLRLQTIVNALKPIAKHRLDWANSWISLGLRPVLQPVLVKNGTVFIASTDNQECGHVQFFTRKHLKNLFASCSLSVIREAPGSFLCGPIIGHTLARYDRFIRWNARITDKLPLAFASSWYFVLHRSSETKRK
jgi:SAM-dependent methyltransferase